MCSLRYYRSQLSIFSLNWGFLFQHLELRYIFFVLLLCRIRKQRYVCDGGQSWIAYTSRAAHFCRGPDLDARRGSETGSIQRLWDGLGREETFYPGANPRLRVGPIGPVGISRKYSFSECFKVSRQHLSFSKLTGRQIPSLVATSI